MEYSKDYLEDPYRPDVKGPYIELTVSNCFKDDLTTSDIFLIDTGTDFTIINTQIFDIIDLEPCGYYIIQGVTDSDETEEEWAASYLDIEIPELKIRERFKVAVNEKSDLNLLGLDFLKHIRILLDGPTQRYTIFND